MAEERGMVSSGRQQRGEVFSLLGQHIETVGIESFFANISKWADCAFIDTIVLLAHHKEWPSNQDRFASDLFLINEIQSTWLKKFTMAAQQSPIPIILGGHSLLTGDLLAFCLLAKRQVSVGD